MPVHEGLQKDILRKDGFLAQQMYPTSLKATGIVQPEISGKKEPKTRFDLKLALTPTSPALQVTGNGAMGVQLYNLFFKHENALLLLSDTECYWDDLSDQPANKELWQRTILWAFSPWLSYQHRSTDILKCDNATHALTDHCAQIEFNMPDWQGFFAFSPENFTPLYLENQHVKITYTAWRQMPDGLMFPVALSITLNQLKLTLNITLKDVTLNLPEHELGFTGLPTCTQTTDNHIKTLFEHFETSYKENLSIK